MQQSWIITYITIVVMMAHGYAQDVTVSLVPRLTAFSATDAVNVTVTFKNNGDNPVLIYKRDLPNGEPFGNLFDVSVNGQPVAYIGAAVKRSVPTAEDTVTLNAGQAVSAFVLLSLAYNMTPTGNYVFQFNAVAGPISLTSGGQVGTGSSPSTGFNEYTLQSDPIVFFVVGRPNPLLDQSAQIDTQVKASTYTYISCSTSQKSSIASAIRAGASYCSSTLKYLTAFNHLTSKRYPTWFGTYSLSNLITLRTQFTNINAVFSSKPMSFDCSCNMANTYAYVYPTQPYKIYLCPVFWPSPITGTDSKGGTLIHEISHFKIVAGTSDYAYGQAACKALAKSNPSKALMNADSHQYFAENNPPLA